MLTFSDLPEVKTITVQIYKESDGKNKKEKRKPVGEKFQFFPSTLTSHSEVECSHTLKISKIYVTDFTRVLNNQNISVAGNLK